MILVARTGSPSLEEPECEFVDDDDFDEDLPLTTTQTRLSQILQLLGIYCLFNRYVDSMMI